MKILLINRSHFVNGGADRVYLNTGRLLEDNGIEVVYFSSKSSNNEHTVFEDYFVEPVKTRDINIFGKLFNAKKYLYNSETSLKLDRLIRTYRPDVAHIHLFYGALSSSLLSTLKENNIPIVLTIHDYRLLCPANAMIDNLGNVCEKCKSGKFYSCIMNRCSEGSLVQSAILMTEAYMRKFIFDPLNIVDHFIFVSYFSLNKHIEFDRRFQAKSSHLYNFSKTHMTSKYRMGDYFLYYGRLSREKGVLTLIEAIATTEYKLIIAGDGPLKEDIIRLSSRVKNVTFVGFKENSDLQRLILGSSYVVVPSEWYENNPMTIVESFLLGKPVIGSNIGGIPELVNSNRGFLFEPKNIYSLFEVLNTAMQIGSIRYNLISENCYNFAINTFDETNHFNELLTIYNKVLIDAQVAFK